MEYPFWPKRVYFEPAALQYPRGRELRELFIRYGVPVHLTSSHNQVRGIPGDTAFRAFNEAKQTLVIGKRRLLGNFQTCRPSAHYQLPLATGCPGRCCYCYLHTTLGKKPYLRAYINVEEILERAGRYIAGRAPAETSFEGAAVGDPLFVEPFTGAVSKAIEFFGGTKTGRFRLVTKFNQVGPFLKLDHNGHTRFRFSINSEAIIEKYEYGTPGLQERLEAAKKIISAGYPAGFLIAPIFLEHNWRKCYRDLLYQLAKNIPLDLDITFELISHRFTARAKQNIEAIFPNAKLDMNEQNRCFRFGQFGYGKYLYPESLLKEAGDFLNRHIRQLFPNSAVLYFV